MNVRRVVQGVALTLFILGLAACASAPTPGPAATASATPAPLTATPGPTFTPTLRPLDPLTYIGPLPAGAVARLGQGLPRTILVSPNRALVALGTTTGVLVYDAATRKLSWSASTTEAVSSLAWSADDAWLAAGLLDGRVTVWNTLSGAKRLDLPSNDGMIAALSWSPDGRILVSSGAKGASTVRDGVTGGIIHRLIYHEITDDIAYTDPITGIEGALSPDGQWYATHYEFGGAGQPRVNGTVIVVWDVATGSAVHALETAKKTTLAGMAWSPDSQLIANGSQTSPYFNVWEAASGKVLHNLWVGQPGFSVSWSPDGTRILAMPADHAPVVLDVVSEEQVATLKSPASGSAFVSWSADGARVTTYDRRDSLTTYAVATGEAVGVGAAPPFFAIGGPYGESVEAWSGSTGDFAGKFFTGTLPVNLVGWVSPQDAQLTATPTSGDTLWDGPEGAGSLAIHYYQSPGYWMGGCIKAFFMPGDRDLADISCPSDRLVSPDGSIMAVVYNTDDSADPTGQRAGVISIHDYKTGARLRVLRGHASFITSVAFTSDGKYLATGSDDGTVIVWDMSRK